MLVPLATYNWTICNSNFKNLDDNLANKLHPNMSTRVQYFVELGTFYFVSHLFK